jgi:hypothetical protein
MCNLKMIRHDYPRLHTWLRTLYWDTSAKTNHGVFKNTTFFDIYKFGYMNAKGKATGGGSYVLPKGPLPNMLPLDHEMNGNGIGIGDGKVKEPHGDENAKWEARIPKSGREVHLTQP